MKHLISALAAVIGFGSAQAATITNGSFEANSYGGGTFAELAAGSTVIDGWIIGAGGVDLINTYWNHADGDYSLDLSRGSAGMVSTTITDLIVGGFYQISFEMAGNPAGGASVKDMEVSVGGINMTYSFDVTGHSLADLGWMTMTLVFKATSASEVLSFLSLEGNAYGPALDNVQIEAVAVPLPGAFLLMGTGLVAAGVARRRLKQA